MASDMEQPTYPPVPSFRECITFAINAVGIYAAPTLMSLIDAAFIGRVSTTQLAALGPAGSISDSVPFFLLFVSIAATNMVAKSSAADDTSGSRRIARTAISFGALGGAVLAVATILGAAGLSQFYCGANVALAPLCDSSRKRAGKARPSVSCRHVVLMIKWVSEHTYESSGILLLKIISVLVVQVVCIGPRLECPAVAHGFGLVLWPWLDLEPALREVGAHLLRIGNGDDGSAGTAVLSSLRRRRGAKSVGRAAARTAGAEDHTRAGTPERAPLRGRNF